MSTMFLRLACIAAMAIAHAGSAAAGPFLGQITTLAGNFCPLGWAVMDGRLMSISENDALYSLIGNAFGGSAAQGTFALPAGVPQFTATGIPLRQCIALEGIFPARP